MCVMYMGMCVYVYVYISEQNKVQRNREKTSFISNRCVVDHKCVTSYVIQVIKQQLLQTVYFNTASILIPEKATSHEQDIFSFNKSLLSTYASLTCAVPKGTYK